MSIKDHDNGNSGDEARQGGVASRRSLKKTMDDAMTRAADHRDVVVDLKDAEGARLELLGSELHPVFSAIDETDDRFDIGITKGSRPRLWVDMTTFVAMGHDKRTYRFIKDTRMGRIVLAETVNMERMADIVSDYIAEKVLERERMIEGEWLSMRDVQKAAAASGAAGAADSPADQAGAVSTGKLTNNGTEEGDRKRSLDKAGSIAEPDGVTGGKTSAGRALLWFLIGVICTLGAFVIAAYVMVPDAF